MRVYSSLREIKSRLPRVVLALGVFDGFHLGHQRVIKRSLSVARDCRGMSMVYTFCDHPLLVVDRRAAPPMLMTAAERVAALEAGGVQAVVMTRFSQRLKFTPAEEFIEKLLKKMDLRAVVVGTDFRFGDDRVGTPGLLRGLGKKNGFRTVLVPPLKYRGQPISSSRIRQSIIYGWLSSMPRLLGKYYSVCGAVKPGDGVGKTIGVPTFNLACADRLLPKIGVYLVRVRRDKRYYWGLANVGRAPTRKKHGAVCLEVNLLDFRGSAGSLEVAFLVRLREEKKFADLAALRQQIAVDEKQARRLIATGRYGRLA